MKDPVRGLTEMARRDPARGHRWPPASGTTAASGGPLSLFWHAAAELDPSARRDADASPGSTAGDLERLMGAAGLVDVRGGQLSVTIHLASFEDWWAPFEEPAGSAGDYLATRSPDQIAELREHCRSRLLRRPVRPDRVDLDGHRPQQLHPTLTRPFSTGGSGRARSSWWRSSR